MRIRLYCSDDRKIVEPWYLERGWGGMPADHQLPQTGFVAESPDGPLAVAFMYSSDSSLSFILWPATRPGFVMRGLAALTCLMDHIASTAQAQGKSAVLQFVHSEKLVSFYERHSLFKIAETGTLMSWAANGGRAHGS